MATINFLPSEQKLNKQVSTTSHYLKVMVAALGVICLVIGIGGTGIIVLKSTNVSSLTKEQENLKSQVLAQESSEQTLVLLRDRLTKIASFDPILQRDQDFNDHKALIDALPAEAKLKQVSISDTQSAVGIILPDSTILNQVLTLVKSGTIKNPTIDSLQYNSATGYTLTIAKK